MKTYTITDSEQIKAVINQATTCFVGFSNGEEPPYVIPMNFVYVEGCFYLHSGPSGRKYELLNHSNRISITLSVGEELVWQHPDVACSYGMRSCSVMCWGAVTFVDALEEKARILNHLMERFTGRSFRYSEPALRHVRIWRIEPEEISCRSFGNSAKQPK